MILGKTARDWAVRAAVSYRPGTLFDSQMDPLYGWGFWADRYRLHYLPFQLLSGLHLYGALFGWTPWHRLFSFPPLVSFLFWLCVTLHCIFITLLVVL